MVDISDQTNCYGRYIGSMYEPVLSCNREVQYTKEKEIRTTIEIVAVINQKESLTIHFVMRGCLYRAAAARFGA